MGAPPLHDSGLGIKKNCVRVVPRVTYKSRWLGQWELSQPGLRNAPTHQGWSLSLIQTQETECVAWSRCLYPMLGWLAGGGLLAGLP